MFDPDEAEDAWRALLDALDDGDGQAALALMDPASFEWLERLRGLALSRSNEDELQLSADEYAIVGQLRELTRDQLVEMNGAEIVSTRISDGGHTVVDGTVLAVAWREAPDGSIHGGSATDPVRLARTESGLRFDSATLASIVFALERDPNDPLRGGPDPFAWADTPMPSTEESAHMQQEALAVLQQHVQAVRASDSAAVRATVSDDTIHLFERIRLSALDGVGEEGLFVWRVRQSLPVAFLASATGEELLERTVRDGLVGTLVVDRVPHDSSVADDRTVYFWEFVPTFQHSAVTHVLRVRDGRWGVDWSIGSWDVQLAVGALETTTMGPEREALVWSHFYGTPWSETLFQPLRTVPEVAATPPLTAAVTGRITTALATAVRQCREQHLLDYPGLTGRIDVRATVRSGALRGAETTYVDLHHSALRDCLVEAVGRLETSGAVEGTRMNLPILLVASTNP